MKMKHMIITFKEDTRMNIELLQECLSNGSWGKEDYRELKPALMAYAQERQKQFVPLKKEEYLGNPIQVIDFFSGAGGTSLGFAAINAVVPAFDFLGGCDINRASAESYAHNFGTPLINRDIIELAQNKKELDRILAEIGYDINKPTIIIGCAPCQGFTSHRKKHWDKEDDVRNNLVNMFAEIVGYIQPIAFVMENVPEFLSNRYWKYFSSAKKKYLKNGYIVKENIYNAASFGVPQERFRSIVIGMRKDFLLPEGFLTSVEYKSVRDAIGGLRPVPAGVADPNDAMHKSAAHKKSTIEVLKQVPHDGGNRPIGVGPACLDRTKGFSDTYGRLFWDRPSITITHYARNPASGRYTHPEQDRGLTAREAALLQSFPYGFEFMGSSDDIFRQIGEAVPPLFAVGIATDILIELLSSEPLDAQLEASPKSIENPVSSSYSSVIAGIKIRRKEEMYD
jgi:DNA (cytosine-5)-methyltransferase 1